MARNHADPGAPAGYYGSLRPPDQDALLREVESDLARMPALDEGLGGVLDPAIDAKAAGWDHDIDLEYKRQVQLAKDELARIAPDAAARQRLVDDATAEQETARQMYDKAHREAVDPASRPSSALVPAQAKQSGPAHLVMAHTPPGTALTPHDPAAAARAPRRNPRRGYGPGRVDGLSAGDLAHYGVLTLAMLADFVAFYQVLALILGSLPELLYVAVLAVTLMAVYLMHKAGETFRDFVARHHPGGDLWIVVVCVLGWALLGAGAYWLRLTVEDDEGASTSLLNFGGFEVGEDDTSTATKAMVFLIVYVTTGVLAMVGAYLARHPYTSAYRAARRNLRRKTRRLRRVSRRAAKLLARQRTLNERLEAEAAVADGHRGQRRALACVLKTHVRTQIAQRLHDPEQLQYLLGQPIPGCSTRPAERNSDAAV
ncbi:hypothetical protein CS0771_61310 [Catellatospora sp. IY07-71]|uniref:hypothetical protein n=1 Tax=Catellatospora sp. IY07-71 TaxID=2728827 RepID=UPI001BB342E1|nr:hypothetical protein [Catellatospora sp. IY07-71]BCJ76587.1 hypothetical protein CS0771_61310 [Catellatospora sp. IY07-71]